MFEIHTGRKVVEVVEIISGRLDCFCYCFDEDHRERKIFCGYFELKLEN